MSLVPTLAPNEYADRVRTASERATAQARLDTAAAAHTEAARLLAVADDEWDPDDSTTWETFAAARAHHAATNEALHAAHLAF